MQREINIGTAGIDNTGDTLYEGGQKINQTWDDIYRSFARRTFTKANKTLHAGGCFQVITNAEMVDLAGDASSNPFYDGITPVPARVYNAEAGDLLFIDPVSSTLPTVIRLPDGHRSDTVTVVSMFTTGDPDIVVAVPMLGPESIYGIGQSYALQQLSMNTFRCFDDDLPNLNSAVWSLTSEALIIVPSIDYSFIENCTSLSPVTINIPKAYMKTGMYQLSIRYSNGGNDHSGSSVLHFTHDGASSIAYEESALLCTEINIKPYTLTVSISGDNIQLSFLPLYDGTIVAKCVTSII